MEKLQLASHPCKKCGHSWDGRHHDRGCVKSVVMKFGNDQIFDKENFDEMSRRIGWSKTDFSHSL